jgi:hypothetical protein
MIIENPAALQFIINEQIYLSKNDIGNLTQQAPVVAVAEELVTVAAAVVAPEPVITEVPITIAPALVIETPVLNFNYLGKNAKTFLVICHYADADTMDEKHLAALTSTLQRKELNLDDVAIVNLAQHASATVRQIHSFFKPSRLLILGKQGILPGWDTFVFNQLLEKNGFKALYTDSFTDMMGDRDKTKAFWEQMKQL